MAVSVLCSMATVVIVFDLGSDSHGQSSRNVVGRDCVPANKVVFVKTHKCASSTVQVLGELHLKTQKYLI